MRIKRRAEANPSSIPKRGAGQAQAGARPSCAPHTVQTAECTGAQAQRGQAKNRSCESAKTRGKRHTECWGKHGANGKSTEQNGEKHGAKRGKKRSFGAPKFHKRGLPKKPHGITQTGRKTPLKRADDRQNARGLAKRGKNDLLFRRAQIPQAGASQKTARDNANGAKHGQNGGKSHKTQKIRKPLGVPSQGFPCYWTINQPDCS